MECAVPPATHAAIWFEVPWLDIIAAEDVCPDPFTDSEWKTQKGRLRLRICASGNTASSSAGDKGVQLCATDRIAAVTVHAVWSR